MGDPGAADVHGMQETGDIGRGGFALHVRIGGEDDLGNLLRAETREEFPDMDVIRTDALHGGKGAVEHMVEAMVLMHPLEGGDIPGIPHDADLPVVAGVIRAAVTGRLNTPDLYTIMQVLGESKVKERITEAINILKG